MHHNDGLRDFSRIIQEVDAKAKTYASSVASASKQMRDEKLQYKYKYDQAMELLKVRESAFDAAKALINSLNRDYNDLALKCDQLEFQRDNISDQARTSHETEEAKQLNLKIKELKAVQREKNALTRDLAKSERMVARHKDQSKLVKELIAERKALTRENAKLVQQNADLTASVELVRVPDAAATGTPSSRPGSKRKRAGPENVVDEATAAARAAAAAAHASQAQQLQVLHQDFESLKEELRGVASKLETPRESPREDQLMVLLNKNSLLAAEKAQLAAQLDVMTTSHHDTQTSNESLRMALKAQKEENASLAQSYQQTESANASLRSALKAQKDDNAQLRRTHLAEFSASMEKLKQLLDRKHSAEMQELVNKHDVEMEKMEDELLGLISKCTKAEQQLAELTNKNRTYDQILQLKEEVIAADERLLAAYDRA
ncbi:hypothetical protein ABC855_g4453 [[Candida] zeylanoides]